MRLFVGKPSSGFEGDQREANHWESLFGCLKMGEPPKMGSFPLFSKVKWGTQKKTEPYMSENVWFAPISKNLASR